MEFQGKIFTGIVAIVITLLSCRVQENGLQTQRNSQIIDVYQYEYIGLEYPDSIAEKGKDMEAIIALFPKDPAQQYVISDQKVALLSLDSLGTIKKRLVYSRISDSIMEFIYENDSQFYIDCSMESFIDNYSGIFRKSGNVRMEISTSAKPKYFGDIKCEKYNFIADGKLSKYFVYVNENIPVKYFKGIDNAPVGIPFFHGLELMPGIILEYGVVKKIVDTRQKERFLDMNSAGYVDYKWHNNKLLDSAGLNLRISDIESRMGSYLYVRNDTIVSASPTCFAISENELTIENGNLNFTYIIPEREDTTTILSNGRINSVEIIADSLSVARYTDKYGSGYGIYLNAKRDSFAFGNVWKTGRKSAFLWESFTKGCKSDQEVIAELKDVASKVLDVPNPKIFIAPYSEFQSIPWMMEVANYGFSSRD